MMPANQPAQRDYLMPLTATMVKALQAKPWVKAVEKMHADPKESIITYPIGVEKSWTHENYGPILIPKKGMKLHLDTRVLPYYARCIKNYEGNELEVRGDQILINGEVATSYTFKMDYYWMMGDNRHNSADSRYWGFVPEDHIVGTPMVVLISFDKDKSLFGGGIRWNRLFKGSNPDKSKFGN